MPPDVLACVKLLLDGAGTRAEGRNSGSLPKNPAYPRNLFRRDGGPQTSKDLRIDTARIVVYSYADTDVEAYELALEVRKAFLPHPAEGFYGVLGGVTISGVRPDAGISWAPDPVSGKPGYRASYLVPHY